MSTNHENSEILDLTKKILGTVQDQPSRDDIKNMAKVVVSDALLRHEEVCHYRNNFTALTQQVGALQGKEKRSSSSPKKVSPTTQMWMKVILTVLGIIGAYFGITVQF